MTEQVVRLMRNYRNRTVELLPVITASEGVNLWAGRLKDWGFQEKIFINISWDSAVQAIFCKHELPYAECTTSEICLN